MRALTPIEVLDVVDEGAGASPAARWLALIGRATGEGRDVLAGKPLGWMATQLLGLRAEMFGPCLSCLATCPNCRITAESEIGIADIVGSVSTAGAADAPSTVEVAGYRLDYRLPTCRDLLSLRGDAAAAGRSLSIGLIGRASRDGEDVDPAALPADLYRELARAVLASDPLSKIEFLFRCSGCGVEWGETLDVVDFVWRELEVLARNLTTDVARLAAAYGWREADILAMSDRRRRRYLDMLPS